MTQSDKSENFFVFNVPIMRAETGQDQVELEECLKIFFEAEKLTGRERYHCLLCSSKRNATKFTEIEKLPKTICISLKRFNRNGDKVSSPVSYSLSKIELKEKSGWRKYSLSGLITHHGSSVRSGHYTAFCRNPETNALYRFSDENVQNVDSMTVRRSEAYILQCTNRSTSWVVIEMVF